MSSVAERPDVRGPVERVMSGDLFTGLLLDETEQRALALESLLGKVVDDDTRLVWVGNPLRSPLTIERFLIQIAGPEIDLREERSAKELAQIIAKQIGSETRLLIVVQQPETINAETIQLLVQMGWYLSEEAVQVQFLFAGSSAFVVPRLAEPTMAFASKFEAREPADIEVLQTGPRRRDVLPLIVLLIAITIGVVFSMAPASPDGMSLSAPTPHVAGSVHPSPAARSTRVVAASDRNPAAACP